MNQWTGALTERQDKFWNLGSALTGRVSPERLLSAVNPATGTRTYWRHVGQPVLFSGDLGHCRRIAKVVSKAGRGIARRGR